MKYKRTVNSVGVNMVKIDGEGIKLPDGDPKIIEEYSKFVISTYSKYLQFKDDVEWDSMMSATNRLFDFLDDDTNREIIMMLLGMHYDIIQFKRNGSVEKIPDLLSDLAEHLFEVDNKLGLFPKILLYCKEHIPLGDVSNIGKSPQDTRERTYYPDEIQIVLTMTMYAKLMFPILGVLMDTLATFNGCKLKESQSVVLFRDIFDKRCPEIVDKLQNTIRTNLKKGFDEDMTSAFNGLTANTLCNQIYSSMLTRNFVNVDLFRKNGKVMTFINSSINKTIITVVHGMNSKRAMARVDMSVGEDANKKSQLEIDSIVSNRPSDQPLIMTSSLDREIAITLGDFDIPMDEYKQCVDYYLSAHVYVTKINEQLLTAFASKYICGAASLKDMMILEVTKIATLLQLVALTCGYRELAHMVTAHSGTTARVSSSKIDQVLRMSYVNDPKFKAFRLSLEQTYINAKYRQKHWDRICDELAQNVTMKTYLYNTAPIMWEAMELNSEEYNGKPIGFTENLIPSYSKMMGMILDGGV